MQLTNELVGKVIQYRHNRLTGTVSFTDYFFEAKFKEKRVNVKAFFEYLENYPGLQKVTVQKKRG